MKTEFKELRNSLPWDYIKRISDEVPGVTKRQVRAVFKGEITNQDIIEKVVEGASKVINTTCMRDMSLLKKMKAAKRLRKITKPAA